jgi:hypothetical protein
MIHKLQYFCIFCNKPGEVEYDDTNPLREEQVAFWLKHVACDPCAIYHRASRDSIRAIGQICGSWAAIKGTKFDDLESRDKTRKKLALWLNKLGVVAANFKHAPNRFEPVQVETLIDEPQKMSGAIRSLAYFSTQPQP